jgi:hypothetical protein
MTPSTQARIYRERIASRLALCLECGAAYGGEGLLCPRCDEDALRRSPSLRAAREQPAVRR